MLAVSLLLNAPLRGAGGTGPGSASVLVVASPAVEAHRMAIQGIEAAMAKTGFQVQILDLNAARSLPTGGTAWASPGTRAIIAIGSEALQIVTAGHPAAPVICTMVLQHTSDKNSATAGVAATVTLDVSIEEMAARLRQIFPGRTRLGIIRNPASGRCTPAQLQARAQSLGFTVRVVDVAQPEQLLPALISLKGQVDFVWCTPDGLLYNGVTIKPLILASLENRLPLIGFSESFARAGAALGVYPDFNDIGLQTGEAARQVMERQPVRVPDGPRKLKLAINQSVLRLLGLRYASAAEHEEYLILR
ncbi:MAG TPA: ABC transporter substrate binding protein [Bryobacteraceae bacterium]|nr:ABC transporter substrate binding protein [Bryobacteraceae bacterium]